MILPAVSLAATLSAATASGVSFDQITTVQRHGVLAPGVRSRVSCSGRHMRLEPADGSVGAALVLRLDEDRALRLDPETRTATELDVERLRARSQSDAALAAGLMGAPGEDELRQTALAGTRTIAGHACRGYRIAGRFVTVEAWVAEDVPARPAVFADFLEWSGAGQALAGLVAAVRALPGFPLETRMRVSVLGEVQETVSTVTAIRVAALPDSLFDVPAGWRVVREAAPTEVPR
jgi:Domain of unknown function (DUF4412)